MREPVRLMLLGDVMMGRGIDQILPHPGDPTLYEDSMDSALGYVELAERAGARISRPVPFDYVWGDAFEGLDAPRVRLINLETAITADGRPWPDKPVLYRMHPRNVPALTAGRIDACALANNHVLDWGPEGLLDTLGALDGIRHAGAGRDGPAAEAPAVLEAGPGVRVLFFALGSVTSGIPASWAAGEGRPGVHLLEARPDPPEVFLAGRLAAWRRPGDVVVVSINWGPNWGYDIPRAQRALAHRLVEAGADVIHGHSSHHVKALEVHGGRLILYGCGDFLNDYEGIGGHESFRGDLGLVYLADLDPSSGALRELRMVPTRVRGLRANRASEEEAERLERTLNREGAAFGTRVRRTEGNLLRLEAGAGLPFSSAGAPPSEPGPASGRAGRRKRGPP